VKSNFVSWVKNEYKDYGDTSQNLIEIAVYFSEQGFLEEYVEYLKEHFNNAFSEFEFLCEHVNAKVISKKLSGEAREVLNQIVKSPKFDGDVASRGGKSELFAHKLILRIANNNDFGDNAANSLGFKVWQELQKKIK
jgi:hypothetical protein